MPDVEEGEGDGEQGVRGRNHVDGHSGLFFFYVLFCLFLFQFFLKIKIYFQFLFHILDVFCIGINSTNLLLGSKNTMSNLKLNHICVSKESQENKE